MARLTPRLDEPDTFKDAASLSFPQTGYMNRKRCFQATSSLGQAGHALFKFVHAGLARAPLDIYGHGQMRRNFTYVDDLVKAVVWLVGLPPEAGQPASDLDWLCPVAPIAS